MGSGSKTTSINFGFIGCVQPYVPEYMKYFSAAYMFTNAINPVQANSALAGCKAREKLGYGPCVGVEINCKTLNLVTGECDACDDGYSIDYTGHCAKKSICGANQWSVNGDCLGVPDNCV